LLEECDACAFGSPHSKGDLTNAPRYRRLHHRSEVFSHAGGVRDDVERTQQPGCDEPQFIYDPVRPDAAAIPLEPAFTALQLVSQLSWVFALVAPVGEQNRVTATRGGQVEGSIGPVEPRAHGGTTSRSQSTDSLRCCLALLR